MNTYKPVVAALIDSPKKSTLLLKAKAILATIANKLDIIPNTLLIGLFC